MGLAEMKSSLHDRLWNAQQRWFALRAGGATKHELKLRGICECADANRYIRNVIFTGSTKRAVEETLKSFVEFANEKFGVGRLEDLGRQAFRAFIEDGIARGLAAEHAGGALLASGEAGRVDRSQRGVLRAVPPLGRPHPRTGAGGCAPSTRAADAFTRGREAGHRDSALVGQGAHGADGSAASLPLGGAPSDGDGRAQRLRHGAFDPGMSPWRQRRRNHRQGRPKGRLSYLP